MTELLAVALIALVVATLVGASNAYSGRTPLSAVGESRAGCFALLTAIAAAALLMEVIARR